jgi:hypothetical protein
MGGSTWLPLESSLAPLTTHYTDLVDCCVELGCLEDWIVQRIEAKNIVYSSNMFTSSSVNRICSVTYLKTQTQ